MATKFTIRTPSSSANIGPGFDVIGIALSLYLDLTVTISPTPPPAGPAPLNCTISASGEGASGISLDPSTNLITRVALYVLRCHSQSGFPAHTHVDIHNNIPLGRGLGSSGAAVVGGVALANECGKLGLSRDRMLDYCLMVERHPDNIAAALYGGFVGTLLNELSPEMAARLEVPLAEVLPAPAGGVDTGLLPPIPPTDIGVHFKYPWNPEIKVLVLIPDFEVPTHSARAVMPASYPIKDFVFNAGRLAVLTHELGKSPPDAAHIYRAMQDRIHQQYRQDLIPGLREVLQVCKPANQDGFLGVCLSGAGPTILALVTGKQEEIGEKLMAPFREKGIGVRVERLELAQEGTVVKYVD